MSNQTSCQQKLLDLNKFGSRLGLQDIVTFEKEGIPSKPWVT